MGAITACRTAVLGGHVEQCDDCGATRIAYNSCRNRHCPKCQGAARAQWLAERQAELLPVPYFHVVFTLPAPAREIAFQNKAVVYAILFRCAAETLTFAGHWRIVEMDNWDSDFLDLVEEAHLTFKGKSDGEIAFGALKGFLDVRYGARDGSACAEFSWEGHDENDPVCGRGWVMIGTAGRLVGHFYIHKGDDSGLVCERS
jgi:Transposase zinc-binding domain